MVETVIEQIAKSPLVEDETLKQQHRLIRMLKLSKYWVEYGAVIAALAFAPLALFTYRHDVANREIEQILNFIDRFNPALTVHGRRMFFDENSISVLIPVTNEEEFEIEAILDFTTLLRCRDMAVLLRDNDETELSVLPNGGREIFCFSIAFDSAMQDGRYLMITGFTSSSPVGGAYLRELGIKLPKFQETSTASRVNDILSSIQSKSQDNDATEDARRNKDGLNISMQFVNAFKIADGNFFELPMSTCSPRNIIHEADDFALEHLR